MTQPYPPQQYPPHQQWGPPPAPRPEANGLATGGFVTALVGAVIALVPFLGIVSWVISPIGLVLSIVGVAAASRRGGTGRGLAISGIVLGALGLLICILYAAAFTAAFQQGYDASRSSSSSSMRPSYSAPSYRAPTTPTAAEEPASTTGPFDQGTYLVGEELEPGRYRTDGAPAGSLFPFCMASRQDRDGTPAGMPETTNEGPAFITVRASDAQVEFSGQCTWTRR